MAKANRLQSGKWRVQVNLGKDDSGKLIRKSITANTKREAERLAEQLKVDWVREQAELKKAGETAQDRQKLMTLREAMEKFIEVTEPDHSVTTTKGYQNLLNNFYQDILDIRLCDLTNDMLQESLNRSAARPSKTTGKPLSRKTLANAKGMLKTVIARYNPDFKINISLPKGLPGKRSMFMHDLKTINNILAKNNESERKSPVELAVRLGLFGFRMSEVLGFRKQDVNLETGIITISQTVVYQNGKKVIRPYAKTDTSMRNNKLASSVIDLIKALPEDQEYLVTVTDKGLQNQWKTVQIRYGCAEDEIMSFHALRHVFASVTAQCGIADNIRQELGGWSNPIVMNSCYTHTFSDAKNEAINKVIQLYDSALDTTVV